MRLQGKQLDFLIKRVSENDSESINVSQSGQAEDFTDQAEEGERARPASVVHVSGGHQLHPPPCGARIDRPERCHPCPYISLVKASG